MLGVEKVALESSTMVPHNKSAWKLKSQRRMKSGEFACPCLCAAWSEDASLMLKLLRWNRAPWCRKINLRGIEITKEE
jgi:hypothetical protein